MFKFNWQSTYELNKFEFEFDLEYGLEIMIEVEIEIDLGLKPSLGLSKKKLKRNEDKLVLKFKPEFSL